METKPGLEFGSSGVHNILSIGAVVDRPKALGDIQGVTYIYAMFRRFCLIDVPEKVKKMMTIAKDKDV